MENTTRAYKTRSTLINKGGKDLLSKLKETYKNIDWYLAVKDGREVCVGVKDGKVLIIGANYETIADNIELLEKE
jgi:hypothetical protein